MDAWRTSQYSVRAGRRWLSPGKMVKSRKEGWNEKAKQDMESGGNRGGDWVERRARGGAVWAASGWGSGAGAVSGAV